MPLRQVLMVILLCIYSCKTVKSMDSRAQFAALDDLKFPTLLHVSPANLPSSKKPRVIVQSGTTTIPSLAILVKDAVIRWNASLLRTSEDVSVELAQIGSQNTDEQNTKYIFIKEYFRNLSPGSSDEGCRKSTTNAYTQRVGNSNYQLVFCMDNLLEKYPDMVIPNSNSHKMLRQLALHEVGHMFGLCDQYEDDDPGFQINFNQQCDLIIRSTFPADSIMAATFYFNDGPKDLTPDDVLGVLLLSCLNSRLTSSAQQQINQEWAHLHPRPRLKQNGMNDIFVDMTGLGNNLKVNPVKLHISPQLFIEECFE